MKIRYLLGAGVIMFTLAAIPCSFAQEKNKGAEVVLGQSREIILPQSLKIDTTIEQEKDIKEVTPKVIDTVEEVNDYVYTTNRVNIRTHVGVDSNILLTAEVGTKLERVGINVTQGWDMVLINNEKYYLSNEFLTTEEPDIVAKSIEEQIEDNKISETDLRYMSAIIFAEAGNQCQAGKQAVGIVVMERVESDAYKDTVYDVIYEPGQFSPVANGSLTRALSLYDNGELSDEVIEAAKYALRGNTTIYYNDTTYDLDGYLYFSRWVDGCRLQIQDHMFK